MDTARNATTGELVHIDAYVMLSPEQRFSLVCPGTGRNGSSCAARVKARAVDSAVKVAHFYANHRDGCEFESKKPNETRAATRTGSLEQRRADGRRIIAIDLSLEVAPDARVGSYESARARPGSTMRTMRAPGGPDPDKDRRTVNKVATILRKHRRGLLAPDDYLDVGIKPVPQVKDMVIEVSDPAHMVVNTEKLYWGRVLAIANNPATESRFLVLATRAGTRASIMLTEKQRSNQKLVVLMPSDLKTLVGSFVMAFGRIHKSRRGPYLSLHEALPLGFDRDPVR